MKQNQDIAVKFSIFVPILVHNKNTTMKIVTSREFRDNQKKYFDLVDKKEQVIVKRSKNRAYKLVPVTDDDMLIEIPKEYRCDPYEISPSGDLFWADKRNVEIVKKAIENKEQIADKLNSADDIKNFLNNL
jgi:hypothetical protein